MANITLKPFDVMDIDDHMDWATDEKTAQFCSWEAFRTKEEFLKYFNGRILNHPWLRAVCLNDMPIGYVLVTPNASDMDECRAEIGYGFGSRNWGKGIATKAVEMVVTEIFEERPKLRRIEAFVVVENVGSQKVLEKVGFCKEGVLREYFVMKGRIRDVALFSILSTDQIHSSASQSSVDFLFSTLQ